MKQLDRNIEFENQEMYYNETVKCGYRIGKLVSLEYEIIKIDIMSLTLDNFIKIFFLSRTTIWKFSNDSQYIMNKRVVMFGT